MISLVVARARGGAIGRDGEMPWHLPEDLRLFQRETRGGAVIMGRRTWESLPEPPLPERFNCVVTRSDVSGADAVVSGLEDAVAACREAGHSRIYGIGGARLYAGLMPMAHRLLITEVDLDVPDADTFFPEFDARDWRELDSLVLREEAPRCVLREFLRRAA